MTKPQINLLLPDPPTILAAGDVTLRLDRIVPGDTERNFVPYYHFRILNARGVDVGHINFRVGDTDHVRLFAGHVGFAVEGTHRGHGYARQACLAIAPLIQMFYAVIVLTCNPDNLASRRTIECLGAEFLEEVQVPPHEPMYENGARVKRRYSWTP